MSPFAGSIKYRLTHRDGNLARVSESELAILDDELSAIIRKIRQCTSYDSALEAMISLDEIVCLFALMYYGHKIDITDRQFELIKSPIDYDYDERLRDTYDRYSNGSLVWRRNVIAPLTCDSERNIRGTF